MAKRIPKKQRGIFERPTGSGIWWICYFDQFGRKHREKVGMWSRANEVYQQRKTEVRHGKFLPEDVKRKHQNVTVAEMIKDRLEAARSLRSLYCERLHLRWWESRLSNRSARSITEKDIEQGKIELSAFLRPASVNRYLASIKAVFSLGVRNNLVDRNPCIKVKLFREDNDRVRYLSDDEEGRLFEKLPQKYKPLVIVALYTGLRKSEQLNLQWKDIDFAQGQITARVTKAGKSRVIPMSETLRLTLRDLSRVRLINNPYVFAGEKPGERQKDLPKYWEQYLKQAEIEDFHWHDLRHTFASRLVMAGVDLYTVMKLLGHSSLKMTQRYAHLSPGYLKSAVSVLDRISGNQVTPEVTPAKTGSL